MKKTSVLIADDNPIIREGLKNYLSLEEDVIVVGEAENGIQALHFVEQLAPDILLMDLEMPGLNGFQVTARLRDLGSPVYVLIVSALGDPEYIQAVLRKGASGFIAKEDIPTILLSEIRKIAAAKNE